MWSHARTECEECGPAICRGKVLARAPDVGVQGGTGAGSDRRLCLYPAEEASAGEPVSTLGTEAAPAAWLLAGRGWYPPPRMVSEHAANCAWRVNSCRACKGWVAELVAGTRVAKGAELTVPRPLTPERTALLWPYELCFDGSVITSQGRKHGGAAAVLWHRGGDGAFTCVARALVALPEEGDFLKAEATGAGLCGDLLGALRAQAGGPWTLQEARRCRIAGDNLTVVRHGAAQARMKSPAMSAIVDGSIGALAGAGWELDWLAIRRDHNVEAHALAKVAAKWAAARSSNGLQGRCVHKEWHTDDPRGLTGANGVSLPPWVRG